MEIDKEENMENLTCLESKCYWWNADMKRCGLQIIKKKKRGACLVKGYNCSRDPHLLDNFTDNEKLFPKNYKEK